MKNTYKILPFGFTCALCVALIFLIWHIPYLSTLNGYQSLALWDFGTWGVLVALFQTLFLIQTIILLTYSVLGILKIRNSLNFKNLERVSFETINLINIAILTFLSLFVFVFTIVLSSTTSLTFGIGSIFQFIFCLTILIVLVCLKTNKTIRLSNRITY